jgi:hypothetical protein
MAKVKERTRQTMKVNAADLIEVFMIKNTKFVYFQCSLLLKLEILRYII